MSFFRVEFLFRYKGYMVADYRWNAPLAVRYEAVIPDSVAAWFDPGPTLAGVSEP
jgi:hypothetical protein